MNNSLLTAAASYYGLSPDNVTASDWGNDNGEMMITFAVRPTEDDMAGILARMKVMREEEAQRQDSTPTVIEQSDEALRHAYSIMSAAQKSSYGSFARFRAMCQSHHTVCPTCGGSKVDPGGLPSCRECSVPVTSNADANFNRKVEHINAPEDSEPVSMDAVWLWEHQTTEVQRRFASDARGEPGHEKQYLIQSAMLTEEQKAQVADRSGGLAR